MMKEFLYKKLENLLNQIKEKQNNRLWVVDLENCRNTLEGSYNVMIDIEDFYTDKTFNEIYNELCREFRTKYTFHYGEKPVDFEINDEQDPFDRTWLNEERFNELHYQIKFETDVAPSSRLNRYLNYLYKHQKLSLETVRNINKEAINTISRCGDPKSIDKVHRQGLVVGSVQSGKTTNFNALINSAYDVGYNMVIVLTGITENLRRQTQKRLNNDLGIAEGGVNLINTDPNVVLERINSITSETQDFNNAILRADFAIGGVKSLIVSKKNPTSLYNIYQFLERKIQERHINGNNFSLLIVDDEADNATLNARGAEGDENEATPINGLTRAILALFGKKTYVAYTATPFANILQDNLPESEWNYRGRNLPISSNLYPRNFVRLLSPPANYIGPKLFFDTKSDSNKLDFLIKEIYDYKDKFPERIIKNSRIPVDFAETEKEFDKNSILVELFPDFRTYSQETCTPGVNDVDLISSIPASLKDAIICFIITIAIRNLRRRENNEYVNVQIHDTMLIHISRFSSWQNKLKSLLTNEIHDGVFDEIKTSLENDIVGEGVYNEFERVWNVYYEGLLGNINNTNELYHDDFITTHSFNDILPLLPNAINHIEIISLNSQSPDRIEYDSKSPKKYIVIGGNTLSRGFTLEGLSISYYCRNTNYADSILQMGRWFGYRPGYLDCCRLFVDKRSLKKYAQCVEILSDLEEDIKMQMNNPALTPASTVNRIKATTGKFFKITRPAILRNGGEAYFSFSDKMLQAIQYDLDSNEHINSFENFKGFINKYQNYIEPINNNSILKLSNQRFETVRELIDTSSLINENFDKKRIYDFINECIENYNYLTDWEIVFVNSGRGEFKQNIHGIDFNSVVRSGPTRNVTIGDTIVETKAYKRLREDKFYSVRQSSIISPSDLRHALTEEQVKNLKIPKNRAETESDYRRLLARNQGVLLVYLIDTNKVVDNEINKVLELDTNIPIVGFALAIPDLEIEPLNYYVGAHINEENAIEIEEDEPINE